MFKRKNDIPFIELGSDAEIIPLKGTLTILSDSMFVLGFPSHVSSPSNELLETYRAKIAEWIRLERGLLVFPFPIEVIDMRKQELVGKEDR